MLNNIINKTRNKGQNDFYEHKAEALFNFIVSLFFFSFFILLFFWIY